MSNKNEITFNNKANPKKEKQVFPNTIEKLFAEIREHERVVIFNGKYIIL